MERPRLDNFSRSEPKVVSSERIAKERGAENLRSEIELNQIKVFRVGRPQVLYKGLSILEMEKIL